MSTGRRRCRNRRRRIIGRLLSYLFILAGAALLFRGGRDLWESRQGQAEAERELEAPAPAPAESAKPVDRRLPLGTTVAKLTIPRLDAQLYVVEGVGQSELRRGPGHMPGSALPGDRGNCVVAAHRDTHFRLLKDIRRGDDIVLETRGGLFLYRVKNLSIVTPQNTASIQPSTDAVLHLITCYPFYYVGAAPKRYIVEAGLAGALPVSQPAPPQS
ncbi:MAG TPA: class D sortase [Bryobacteraceae bacterium]|nr:class D sortase [Bryobacteraceae bacterium]